jgi:ATP-dependent DNA helicase PIF1
MSKRTRDEVHSGLGPSQLKAFAKIVNGESLFVTGSAGTGKTELLRRVIKQWLSNGTKFAITASTGIAAIGVGGKTFHSFMWLRPDDEDSAVTSDHIFDRLVKSKSFKFYQNTMRSLESLVIDEISMLGPDLLSKASDVLKIVRQCGEPFGGLQVVLVGDFFQLPPVKASKFLFEEPIFSQTIQATVTLLEVFRQKDTVFVDLLRRMRTATLTDSDHNLLESRVGADISTFGIVPTELWSTNKDVDQLNCDKLSQIKSPVVSFKRHHGMKCSTGFNSVAMDKFLKDMNVPEKVDLKGPVAVNGGAAETGQDESVGAQVMLTYNLNTERGLVNGSRGVIVGFEKAPETRCVSLSFLDDFEDDEDFADKAFIRNMEMPKVRFLCDGVPVTILVPYVCLSRKSAMEGLKTKATCFAWTMPLKLAWATTVHKSQGQSLDCVKATLDRTIFADGQAYVAVSRARTLEGLTLTSYDRSVVKANSAVKAFYSTLV